MTPFAYRAVFSHGPLGFAFHFPAFPYVQGAAQDFLSAHGAACDALERFTAHLLEQGDELPEFDVTDSLGIYIPVPPALAARYRLSLRLKELGLTKVAAAQRLGCDEKAVRRMLRGECSLDRLVSALAKLGVQVSLCAPEMARND